MTTRIANKPLFVDPVYDGAADPVVCWNRQTRSWFMLYTNRRANAPGLDGVCWVHGTHIGIAESTDGGASWAYRGTADIPLPDHLLQGNPPTHWAPAVIHHDGTYHMYLSFVPGVFADWNHPRRILHLTSGDLTRWAYQSTLSLSSDRVIDADVLQLPDGAWRMWYNDEPDKKSIYFADSPDLYHWQDRGKVIGDQPGEGPVVFRWRGWYWMIVDVWDGLGVYRSDDALQWTRLPGNLLREPGTGPDDTAKGQHCDVIVNHDRAYLFYFVHPSRLDAGTAHADRRSVIQVVELHCDGEKLTCDRDTPTRIDLREPTR